MYNQHSHACHCGTGKPTPHETGTGGCVRTMVEAPIKSLNMSADPYCWLVDGRQITDYTLRYQRGYYQHGCGCWSRSPGSVNSIEA